MASFNPFDPKYAHMRKAIWGFIVPGVAVALKLASDALLNNHEPNWGDLVTIIGAMVGTGATVYKVRNLPASEGS